MADYITSAYLDAQDMVQAGYASHELREQEFPILQKGLTNAPFMFKDVSGVIEATEKKDVRLYQFKREASTGGTALSHDFTGTQGDTMEIQPSFSVISENFSLYMNAGLDNVVNNAQMLSNRIIQTQRIIRERAGGALSTTLYANKTGVANASLLNASFDATTDFFTLTDEELFIAHAEDVMRQHNYNGNYDMLVGSGLNPKLMKNANQGSGNGVNLAWQYGNTNIMYQNSIGTTIAADVSSKVAIMMPQYSFAYIPFVRADFVKGGGSFQDFNGGKTVINDSKFGPALKYTLMGYTVRANGASNGGTTADYLTHWQLALTVAIQPADLSTADETTIYAMKLAG